MLRAVALVALLSTGAFAQNTAIELLAIQAHFKQSLLVPDLLDSFNPTALLSFSYEGIGNVAPGTLLDVEQLNPTPSLTINLANSTVAPGTKYTLALVDPGAPGASTKNVTRHWLANGVTIGADNTLTVPGQGEAITDYGRPFPDEGSGAHRYAFLLFLQPDSFSPPADLSTPGVPISQFNVIDYAKASGLGPVVAANYYTVERGSASFTQASTQPVNSATLSVPAPSGSGSPSGSRSGSPTGGASTSPSPTRPAAASKVTISQYAILALAGLVAIVMV